MGSDFVGITAVKLKVTGQVDAYDVVGIGSITIPAPTPDYREFDLSSSLYGFQISATQDETVLVSSIVPGANNALVDTKDFEDDNLTFAAEITYQFISSYTQSGPVYGTTTKTVSVGVQIKDDDTAISTAQVSLTTLDGTAKEPRAVYYQPVTPADNGSSKFFFPSQWNGGTLQLTLTGTATPSVDYGISVESVKSKTGTVLPISTVLLTGSLPSLTLNAPANVGEVVLAVTAIGDLIETDSGETAVLDFTPANQQFTGTNNTTITVGGSSTVTIDDLP